MPSIIGHIDRMTLSTLVMRATYVINRWNLWRYFRIGNFFISQWCAGATSYAGALSLFFPFFTTLIEYSNYSVQVENAVFSYKCIISKAEHSPGLVMVTVWSRYPLAGRDRSHNSETSHASQEQVALNPGLLRQDRCGDEKWELLPERDAALKN